MEEFKLTFGNIIHNNWMEIIEKVDIKIIENFMIDYKNSIINDDTLPEFENIFRFTKYFNYEDTKVVIIGQDCYYTTIIIDGIEKPIATGLCFSIDKNNKTIPPSLKNINKNLKKYNHTTQNIIDLENWAMQGVLLFNTALTVRKGVANSHYEYWKNLTTSIINILSNLTNKLMFVLWGANAIDLLTYVNSRNEHNTTISSHPSPLSVSKTIKRKNITYEAFENVDHFGIINNYLLEINKTIINWNV